MSALPTDFDADAKMFELAPVSLWIEDFSAVKALFGQWRTQGVVDLAAHLAEDPDRVRQCSECIRIIKVNRKTLALFGARDLDHLTLSRPLVIRDDTFKSHVSELAQLWSGRSHFSSHTVNYTLSGERLDIQLHGTLLPGQTSGKIMLNLLPEYGPSTIGGYVGDTTKKTVYFQWKENYLPTDSHAAFTINDRSRVYFLNTYGYWQDSFLSEWTNFSF